MKRKKVLRQAAALIPNARWRVYAMAGAATALTGAHSAEGNIVHSGLLDVAFNETSKAFQLDIPGDTIGLAHLIRTGTDTVGTARFTVKGTVSAAFRGFPSSGGGYGYVSKLSFGQKISAGPLWDKFGTMVFSGGPGSVQRSMAGWRNWLRRFHVQLRRRSPIWLGACDLRRC